MNHLSNTMMNNQKTHLLRAKSWKIKILRRDPIPITFLTTKKNDEDTRITINKISLRGTILKIIFYFI